MQQSQQGWGKYTNIGKVTHTKKKVLETIPGSGGSEGKGEVVAEVHCEGVHCEGVHYKKDGGGLHLSSIGQTMGGRESEE